MKNNIKTIIVGIVCFVFGLSFVVVSYANSYRSEEISYDNTKSGAEAENVKDAIDYLYSHGSCGEGMSCLESPIVNIVIDGNGNANKDSVVVPINGDNEIKVKPDEGYYLYGITCSEGYTLNTYNTLINSTTELSSQEQNIVITNTRQFEDGICTISFKEGYTTVTLNVSGNGNAESSSIYVPIDGDTKVQVTPNSGYYLQTITCTNGYSVSYNGLDNSTNALSSQSQQIVITNNHKMENGSCNITFGTNEFSISSQYSINKFGSDLCDSANVGCACWYIKNGGSNFTYGSHTGCNFKSKACIYTDNAKKDQEFSCSNLDLSSSNIWYDKSNGNCCGSGSPAKCSGVITCAT